MFVQCINEESMPENASQMSPMITSNSGTDHLSSIFEFLHLWSLYRLSIVVQRLISDIHIGTKSGPSVFFGFCEGKMVNEQS